MKWFELAEDTRKEILNQTAARIGLPAIAVEKDWWVTLALRIVFSLDISNRIIFKGGTSLSKGWNLIERFSEDIDLALDREYLGFKGDLSKNQIKNLRKASYKFITGDFTEMIKSKIIELKIPDLTVIKSDNSDSDTDPIILELDYASLFTKPDYIRSKVLIEIGSRSLMEPTEIRKIISLTDELFMDNDFSEEALFIPSVLPKRTFLEKAFLLHEEFQKPLENIRVNRLSRHLYDLDKLKDIEHGVEALKDIDLYKAIVKHREIFNALRGIDYSKLSPDKIDFVPPDSILNLWEADYRAMQESMIFGESKSFTDLVESIEELRDRFRGIST